MVYRPYQCPMCHSNFRNESGMKWHIAHRHEIPTAFDKLGQDYELKLADLREENIRLKKDVERVKSELQETLAKLDREKGVRSEAELRVLQLDKDRQTLVYALVARQQIIKDKLGIDLPNPFTFS